MYQSLENEGHCVTILRELGESEDSIFVLAFELSQNINWVFLGSDLVHQVVTFWTEKNQVGEVVDIIGPARGTASWPTHIKSPYVCLLCKIAWSLCRVVLKQVLIAPVEFATAACVYVQKKCGGLLNGPAGLNNRLVGSLSHLTPHFLSLIEATTTICQPFVNQPLKYMKKRKLTLLCN